ncbi:hypothetical protein JXA80_03395 [bacterium]|nr:hypothetical protein [candidate division CSSED10-310 bacterium]
MEFDSYYLVLLLKGPNRNGTSQSDMDHLQQKHLDYIHRLHSDGFARVAGPFGEQTDETYRGLILFRSDLPREHIMELAAADPAVRAGQLRYEIVRWYCEKNRVQFTLA